LIQTSLRLYDQFVTWTRFATPILAFAVGIVVSSACWGGDEKLSAELHGNNVPAALDVIIQYKQTPTGAHHQRVIDRGGAVKFRLNSIKAGAYRVPASALSELANDPDVAFITPDREVHGLLDQADATIGASAAKTYGLTGAGVGVAVIDSGIGPNNDLSGKVVYEKQFVSNTNTQDTFGHGTHVAGIIAGSGLDSTGSQYTRTFHGVAEGVSLIDLQVLDSTGAGTDSGVIAAIEEAIALKSKYNIRVINISLGRPVVESYKQDPLCQAVESAWKAGITVVVAAGNYGRTNPTTTYGYGTITAPGNDPYVITVGAMKDNGTATLNDDRIATYSSKGPTLYDMVAKPDLVAPGNLIDSTRGQASNLVNNYPQVGINYNLYATGINGTTPSYMQLSGTSMATPFVSAAAALMIQQHPTLTPDQIKARLMLTADKTVFPATSSYTDPETGITYRSQYDIFTVGAGYLNIAGALASTTVAPTGDAAISPALVFTTSGNLTFLGGANVVWGSNSSFAANVVWGTKVVWGSNVVWGTNVVWGSSNLFLKAANVVWGTNVVWGSIVVWGSNVVWGTTALASQSSDTASAVMVNGDVH
jgi:serine protease AprX